MYTCIRIIFMRVYHVAAESRIHDKFKNHFYRINNLVIGSSLRI